MSLTCVQDKKYNETSSLSRDDYSELGRDPPLGYPDRNTLRI